MRRLTKLACIVMMTCLATSHARAVDLASLLPMLKQGGFALLMRHVATDDSQKDVYPFVFDDMKKQRQLSDDGRKVARDVGVAIKKLGIPLGQVYSSKLNRAIETGHLVSGTQPIGVAELTDSGAASASAMANPNASNTKLGNAIRTLINKGPAPRSNILLVTHKTNIADALGKTFADVKEGEAIVLKPNPSGAPSLILRVRAEEWIAQAKP